MKRVIVNIESGKVEYKKGENKKQAIRCNAPRLDGLFFRGRSKKWPTN